MRAACRSTEIMVCVTFTLPSFVVKRILIVNWGRVYVYRKLREHRFHMDNSVRLSIFDIISISSTFYDDVT